MGNTKFLHYFAWRLVWLATVLSLSISWNALALEWCPNPHAYGDILVATGTKIGPYPTDQAALQAAVDAYHLVSDGGVRKADVISCNGQGVCTVCHSWPSHHCNFDTVYWNGKDDYWHIQSTSPSLILLCSCSMLPSSACDAPLSISLAGGTEIEPSSGSTVKNLPIIVTVVDQNTGQPPTTPVTVKVSLKVNPTSGGHDHGDSTRPRGGIDGTKCEADDTCKTITIGSSGSDRIAFNPTDVSGIHTVTASCEKCSNSPQTAEIEVRVKESQQPDWDTLTASPTEYALIGGEVGKTHHDNHYLTGKARENLMKLINKYNQAFPSGPLLQLNDASLVWGGRFDINGRWNGSHSNHRRGVVIDIRANQDVTAIPQARFDQFETMAKKSGAYADLHCAFTGKHICPACLLDTGPNRHYHVRLLGQGVDR